MTETILIHDKEIEWLHKGDSFTVFLDEPVEVGTLRNINELRGQRHVALTDDEVRRIEDGKLVMTQRDDGEPVNLIHEDYAGTPNPKAVIAERAFEAFKENKGETRSLALEILHMLGYRVEKDYKLVEKDE